MDAAWRSSVAFNSRRRRRRVKMNNQSTFITHVDLRCRDNNSAHRTKEIDRQRLIVRRGQPFSITLQCSDPRPTRHYLELVLYLGERDEVELKVEKHHGARSSWWFSQQGAQDELLLTLHSPPDAAIGQYHLAVMMMSEDGRVLQKMKKISFHLLFNPWCKDDVVYLPDETLLQEYIMNENGVIYIGAWDYITSIPWNYGQFEDGVMDICFEVVGNSKEALTNLKTDIERRCDPVYVSRVITAMVNANDDRGVLAGRWTEPYTQGVAPNRWTGSGPILSQWSRSGLRAVQYAQCWVFAGVACTGEFCCGPCPVVAIKEGDLGVKYDAPFVFAEVNADMVYWIVQQDGQRRKIRVDESSVGRHISTKSVYGDFREDLTLHYKYPEGSNKEREVYERAGRRVPLPPALDGENGRLKLIIKHAKPVFGTDFDVIVEVINEEWSEVQAQLTLLAETVTYTSVHRGECQRKRMAVNVPPHKVHREVLRLHYEDYAACVSEHRLIRVKAFVQASMEEPVMAVADIPLSTPELHIQVAGKAVVWEPVTAYISFSNPLPVPLKGGVFTVEGAGLLTATQVSVDGDISPGQMVSVRFSFSPMRTGLKKLLVDFDSDRLKDVKGAAAVVVRKKYRNAISVLTGFY